MTEEEIELIANACGLHYRLLTNANAFRNTVRVLREYPAKMYAEELNIPPEFYKRFRDWMLDIYFMPPSYIRQRELKEIMMEHCHLMNIAAERCVLKKYKGNPNVVTDVTKISLK